MDQPSARILSDRDVLAACQGDAQAFTRLVQNCANMVCSIALAIVRNVQASEDVAQEVFLGVWTQLGTLRNPASFLPWLRQVTRNKAHAYLRDHRKHMHHDEEDALIAVADPKPTAMEKLLNEEERRVLTESLDHLPEESREVVLLFYREGSSVRQVAQLLEIREDAVKQRLSRARIRLREEMLQRLGETLKKSAPGAAFVAMIVSALTSVAPPVAAAGVAGAVKASTSSGLIIQLTLAAGGIILGAAGGILGVLTGLRKYEREARDETEKKDLQRFKRAAVAWVLFGVAGLAWSVVAHTWILPVIVYVLFVGCEGFLYLGWLPRIIARRFAAERSEDPQAWRRHRKERIQWQVGVVASSIVGAMVLLWSLRLAGLL